MSSNFYTEHFNTELYNNEQFIHQGRYFTLSKIRLGLRWYLKKEINSDHSNNASIRQILIKEFEIGQNLEHECIPKYLSIVDENNKLYLIREFIDGIPLNSFAKISSSTLNNENFIKTYITNILSALSYLHGKNIIHADVSPSNVIFEPSRFQFYLIDFDHAVDKSYVFIPGGTINFSTPEIFDNPNALNESADIYSFGKVLEFICKETNTSKYNKLIHNCISTEIEKRFRSINEINSELRTKKRTNAFLLAFMLFISFLFAINNLQFKDDKINNKERVKAKQQLKATASKTDVSNNKSYTFSIISRKHPETKPIEIKQPVINSIYDSIAKKYSFLDEFIQLTKGENSAEIAQSIKFDLIQKNYHLFESWLLENKISKSESQQYLVSYNKKYYYDFLKADSIIHSMD